MKDLKEQPEKRLLEAEDCELIANIASKKIPPPASDGRTAKGGNRSEALVLRLGRNNNLPRRWRVSGRSGRVTPTYGSTIPETHHGRRELSRRVLCFLP
jgi:hypothetical protein